MNQGLQFVGAPFLCDLFVFSFIKVPLTFGRRCAVITPLQYFDLRSKARCTQKNKEK